MVAAVALLLLHPSGIEVYFNDRKVPMDAEPMVSGSRVLIPLRAVGEALGSYVYWDSAQSLVNVKRGNVNIDLPLRSRDAVVNGKSVHIDQPPMVVMGRTLVPLRFISEYLGAKVTWNARARRVDVRIDA